MAHNGKLYFDFTVPEPSTGQHWDLHALNKMHSAVEVAIDEMDPWNDGDCYRNQWLDLWNVPSNHEEMVKFCNERLKLLSPELRAVEDPPQPIAYCYTGDSRICYLPHTLMLDNDQWSVFVEDNEIPIVLILTYESVCFPIPTPNSPTKNAT